MTHEKAPDGGMRPVLRRNLLKLLAATPVAAFLPGMARGAAVVPTPSATEGPFYPRPDMRFADADNDLVRIAGKVRRAGGRVIVLRGRVLDPNGDPVKGARVEIWQCDMNGRYLHSGDSRAVARDPAFQGFGHFVTGDDGTYRFRTIQPVPYPGRTPHIHVKVKHGGRELTTQFYIDGHPQNSRDWLFRRMTAAERKAVSMVIDGEAGEPEVTVDIVV